MSNQLETRDMLLIAEQLRDFITTNFLFNNVAPLGDETSLIGQGIIDETGALEIVMFVEETYGFRVHESDLVPENFDSIASISAFVADRLESESDDPGAGD